MTHTSRPHQPAHRRLAIGRPPARSALRTIACAVLLAACGSSTAPLDIGDSIVHVADFEDGWDRMTGDTAFIGGFYAFQLRRDISVFSTRCAWLEALNNTGAVHQWLTTDFQGIPNRSYNVSVSWLSGPTGGLESHLWVIGTVATTRPRVPEYPSDFQQLGPLVPPPGEERGPPATFRMDTTVTAPSHGRIWVAVGYRSGFAIRQGVCIDDVMITIERQ